MMDDLQTTSKRNRATKSCSQCRQRKIRCDQEKPVCGTCLKRGRQSLCQYTGPSWEVTVGKRRHLETNGNLKDESVLPFGPSLHDQKHSRNESIDQKLISMQKKLEELESVVQATAGANMKRHPKESPSNDTYSPEDLGAEFPPDNSGPHHFEGYTKSPETSNSCDDDIIDFYRNNYGGTSTFISHGPLSWVSLLRKDIYLRSIVVSSKRHKVLIAGSKNTEAETEFVERFVNETDLEAKVPLPAGCCGDPNCISTSFDRTRTIFGTKIKRNSKEIKNGTVYHADGTKALIASVQNVLNNSKLVWTLFDNFFTCELYCLIPIFDRNDLETQLISIIGPRGAPLQEIQLTKKIQLAIVGSVIILMRLSSLSLYNGGTPVDESSLTDIQKYVHNNPIGKEFVEVAKLCERELKGFKESNIVMFQFKLLMELFSHYSPDGTGNVYASNSTNLGALLEAAMFIGLNRDPDVVNSKYPHRNLLRRLWYCIVHLDYNRTMMLGSPPIIDYRFYDAEYPHLDPSESALDYSINKSFKDFSRLIGNTQELLTLILNIRESSTMKTVKSHLKKLENYVQTAESFDQILQLPSDTVIQRFEKQKKYSNLVQGLILLHMIYHHFFIFYNERGNTSQSLHYLFAILNVGKSLYVAANFLLPKKNSNYNMFKHFGASLDIIQQLQLSLHRVAQIMFTILSRIKGLKSFVTGELDPNILNVIDRIVVICKSVCMNAISANGYVSDTYYHAWAISKMHFYITNTVLTIPPGNNKTKELSDSDKKFFSTLSKLREHDQIFSNYTAEEFSKILDSLKSYDDELLTIDENLKDLQAASEKPPKNENASGDVGNKYNNISTELDNEPSANMAIDGASPIPTQQETLADQFDFSQNDKIWFDKFLTDAMDQIHSKEQNLSLHDNTKFPTEHNHYESEKNLIGQANGTKTTPVSDASISNFLLASAFTPNLEQYNDMNALYYQQYGGQSSTEFL